MAARSTVGSENTRGGSGRESWASQDVYAVMLSFAAGSVDALCYLGLGRIFTANQTGNLVLLGLAISQGHGLDAGRSVASLVGFTIGVVVANVLSVPVEPPPRGSVAVTRALALESVALLVLTLWGTVAQPTTASVAILPYVALMASAMGLQNVVVRALGAPGVTGTAITSTLTLLTEAVGGRFAWPRRVSESGAPTHASAWRIGLLALVVGMYVGAAVVTGIAERMWLLAAGAIPTVTVALVMVANLRQRLSAPAPGTPNGSPSSYDAPSDEISGR
jgi:uncharacterized membrane protein YoaK (UPF0700 family)